MTQQEAPPFPKAPFSPSPDICAPQDRRFVLVAAVLASALGFIDTTVVAIAMPAIRGSLQASLWQAQWVHNAYMLCLTSLILVGGAFGDRFGIARVFGGGIALFVAASLFCALAPSADFMIAARAVQGIGAAVMVPGSLAMISKAYPPQTRGHAIGLWAAASSMTTALGPVIGGLALSLGGPEMWRWIFAINLPLGGLALGILWLKTHGGRPKTNTPIDLPGALLATLALGAIAWGLTSHSRMALLLGAGFMGLFVLAQYRSPHPMVPLRLFQHKVFAIVNTMTLGVWGALGLMFFFMPMTFIAGWGYSEIEASAVFAPMSIFIAGFSTRSGRLADRIGPAPLLVAGAAIVGAGYLLMGLLAPAQNLWGHILPAMCLVGAGMALVVAPLSTAVIGAVPADQTGTASGINNAIARMAGLISVAAVGGLISALYLSAGGPSSFGLVSDLPGHGQAMTRAFQGIAFVAAGLCAFSAVLAGLLPGARKPLAARP